MKNIDCILVFFVVKGKKHKMGKTSLKLNDIKCAIETLNQEIKDRLSKITANKEIIENLNFLNNQLDEEEINKKLLENQQLLEQNRKAILFHTKLVKFYVDLLNGIDVEPCEEIKIYTTKDPELLLQLTMDGKLPISKDNPLFFDKVRLQTLIGYFESCEAYEQCAIIQKRLAELD